MGNNLSRQQQYAYNPAVNGWEMKEEGDEFNVWRHTQTGDEIEEYRRVFSDKRHFDYQREIFEYRHDSDILVASRFFREQSQRDMCSTFYKGNVYLERIPIRLHQINEIPYPDVLHLYQQAFRGFAKLYHKVGYFEPTQDLICVNQQGRVKIWLNQNLAKTLPETVFGDIQRTEANMVRNVVNTIQANTDVSTLPENILDTMRRNSVNTFKDANNVLQDIANRHGTTIPTQLDCVLEMHPELLTRVTRDSAVARTPALSVIQGVPIHQNVAFQVGVAPIALQPTLNRTFAVPISQSTPPFNVHLNSINLPLQAQTITTRPTIAINNGPRVNINPKSASAFPTNNIGKPLSALALHQATRVVNQSNLENKTVTRTIDTTLPRQAMPVIPETYRVSSATARNNINLIRGTQSQTTFATTNNNRTVLHPNQDIQFKLQNLNTTTIGTNNTSIKATGHNNKTIYELESNKLGRPGKFTSSEIGSSIGIKFFDERKPSKTNYTASQSYKKDEFTVKTGPTSSLTQPIAHTSPSVSKEYKIETDYTTILNDKFNYGNYSSNIVKESIEITSNTPTYDYFKSLNTNQTLNGSPKVEFTYSSTYIPSMSLPTTSLSNPFEPIGISTTYQPSKVQYDVLYGGVTSLNSASLADKYKSFETEIIDYHVGSRTSEKNFDYGYNSSLATSKGALIGESLPHSRLATTTGLAGYTNFDRPSNEFGSYQMKYSTYEQGINKTNFDYKSTEEIYKVTESYIATTTNYGGTTQVVAPSLTAYSNLPSSTLTTTPISYTTLSPAKESYNVSMDNELLRDLEKLRSGSKPSGPTASQLQTLNFGTTSEYVRDSIKSKFSH